MKVALIYDRVNKWGGAEKVLLALHKIWPEAPLYTSVYNQSTTPWAKIMEVRTSFIQNLPVPKYGHEFYPFLMGLAFETFNFDEFDVVISVTSEFGKAIITKPKTLHLCYCLNPTGYLWSGYDQYFSSKSELYRKLTMPVIKYLRRYDQIVCHRPDKYVAISKTVSERIKKYYDLESDVVYPPVDIRKLRITNDGLRMKEEDFYLIVSRLVPNKRIDIAIEAFNKLGLKLKIVGVGKEESRLKRMAKNNIEFLGNLTDERLSQYYSNCRALIVPAEEDFGIVAVEAQSFGRPVLAYRVGGSLETIVENKTGWFFDQLTAESLKNKLLTIKPENIDSFECAENAEQFGKKQFLKQFKKLVEEEYLRYMRV